MKKTPKKSCSDDPLAIPDLLVLRVLPLSSRLYSARILSNLLLINITVLKSHSEQVSRRGRYTMTQPWGVKHAARGSYPQGRAAGHCYFSLTIDRFTSLIKPVLRYLRLSLTLYYCLLRLYVNHMVVPSSRLWPANCILG